MINKFLCYLKVIKKFSAVALQKIWLATKAQRHELEKMLRILSL